MAAAWRGVGSLYATSERMVTMFSRVILCWRSRLCCHSTAMLAYIWLGLLPRSYATQSLRVARLLCSAWDIQSSWKNISLCYTSCSDAAAVVQHKEAYAIFFLILPTHNMGASILIFLTWLARPCGITRPVRKMVIFWRYANWSSMSMQKIAPKGSFFVQQSGKPWKIAPEICQLFAQSMI